MPGGLLQKPPDALDLIDGVVVATDFPAGPSVTLAELAAGSPEGEVLAAEAWFNVSHMCYPYGIHAALVRVDRETGGVTIERLFIAYDVGRSVNPMLVDGQLDRRRGAGDRRRPPRGIRL